MDHEVLQMVGERLALLARLPGADAEGEGDVAELAGGDLRRREGEDVGRRILAAEAGVEGAHARVVGQQDHDPIRIAREGRLGRARRQGLGLGQRLGPGPVVDLDVEGFGAQRFFALAASAS